MRYTIEKVKEIFSDGGCTLLENTYKNNRTRMSYMCECGNISHISLSAFLRGQRCKDCGIKKSAKGRAKYTIEKVEEIFLNYSCVLVEKEYIGYHTPMKYICNCGELSKIRLADFLQGQRCQKCKGTTLQKNFSCTYEEVYDYFLSEGCKLLSTEYINYSQELDYICNCGERSTITYGKFKQGQRCKDCGVKKSANSNRLKYDFIKRCFDERGCTLLSTEYIGSKSKLDYICHCGNKHSISFSNFYYHKQVCDSCRAKKVSGENNHNWNPNISQEERENKRQYPEYYDWVKNVYKRDNYTCQCCGDYGGNLNSHHILNYSEHKELRTVLSNGVTLCKSCHTGFHKKYGYYNNNLQQLQEYIHDYNFECFMST